MRALALVAILSLAACSSAADKAAAAYQTASNPNDQCVQARKAGDLYLAEANQPIYEKWRRQADLDCGAARLWNDRAGAPGH